MSREIRRVFVTGSADGLGREAARTLLNDGHEVVVHARSQDRLEAVRDLLAGTDWSGQRRPGSYPDSKLFVTTLAAAVARLWVDVTSNAVDPGWVPTKMGGPGAPANCSKTSLASPPCASADPGSS